MVTINQTLFVLLTAGDLSSVPGKTIFKATTVFPAVNTPSWEIFSYHDKNYFGKMSKYSA